MEVFKYKYDDLFNPTLNAIHKLGGSASISEIEEEVSKILNLSDEELADIHRGNTTKLSYRLAWARNYLKRYGLLENSYHGVWALTPEGSKTTSVNKEKVKRAVKEIDINKKKQQRPFEEEAEEEVKELTWRVELLELIKNISPSSFEKLAQRILRESGFIQVEVTGKSGDEGIDGKGVVKIGGLLSFHVIFQCKRYKDTVGPAVIRDFRGSMEGRADKGLMITTGAFTRDAKKEAQRDGAKPIDLIDGEALVEKLKELELGVKVDTETIENVVVQKDWFDRL
jgi:restriction system protein